MTSQQIAKAIRTVLVDFDNRSTFEVTGKGGRKFAFFATSITDNIPPLQPEMSQAITLLSHLHLQHVNHATLGVGEEDRGAMVISDILLHHQLPRTLARWTPTGGPGEISVPLANEYITEGSVSIYLNGVRAGDRVVLVDDLISTGGTLVALIQAIRKAGAEILEVFTIGEKVENGGRAYILKETGLRVKTLLATGLENRNGAIFSQALYCNLGMISPEQLAEVSQQFPPNFCRAGFGD
jgi:adenine phosphoribosyltransferase